MYVKLKYYCITCLYGKNNLKKNNVIRVIYFKIKIIFIIYKYVTKILPLKLDLCV